MTGNRLKAVVKVSGGIDMLKSHCETLNNIGWVRKSGRPYYIASKTDDDGVVTHFVDRKGG